MIYKTGVHGKDDRWLYTALCGKRAKWPSYKRTQFIFLQMKTWYSIRLNQPNIATSSSIKKLFNIFIQS